MIEITDTLALDDEEIQLAFVRASGPGGQHVNKAATAVQLSFDVANSSSLPEPVRERLIKIAGTQITSDGILRIEAKRFRSQKANRQDAIKRLIKLVRRATRKPKRRIKTTPTRSSKERRLQEKSRRSQRKRDRQSPNIPRYE